MVRAYALAMLGTIAASQSGKVQGLEKDGVLQFRGIPYAAPPVGARRFRAPEPAEPWDGVLACESYRSNAPQPVGGLEAMFGGSSIPSDEDCLFLNVFTPGADDAGRPVLVWIHGGAFQTGSGAIPWYNGARLATAGGVVVVTINYRLGIPGFLRLDHLLGSDYASSGLAGMLDQVAALRWVCDNIAAFGGDPDNVTIFGESAGGMSVATLLAMPAASGLFHRAVAQSGAGHNTLTADLAADVTSAVLEQTGSGAAALLDLPIDELMAAQSAVAASYLSRSASGTRRGLPMAFQPAVGSAALPVRPVDAVRGGAAAGIPLLAGTTRDEWKLFDLLGRTRPTDDDGLLRRATAMFGDGSAAAIDAYRGSRPGAAAGEVWAAVVTDMAFRIPAIRLLEAQGAHAPTYGYLFTWASTAFAGRLGSCHAIEIPFVFSNLAKKGVEFFLGGLDDRAHALAAATSEAWLAFAKTGSPAHDGLPDWPAYDTARRATMVLGPEQEVVDDPGAAERVLWDGIL
jgi:para-nitrobenzyl esterase